jgi:hypothetical protein
MRMPWPPKGEEIGSDAVVYYRARRARGNTPERVRADDSPRSQGGKVVPLLRTTAVEYDRHMNLEGTRRVMETTSHDTANQYLRFGWSLINQYVVEPTGNEPRAVRYVLASVRRLEDTRQVVVLSAMRDVNAHLELGWKLIDKYVSGSESPERRDETMHFVVAWQSEEEAARPGASRPTQALFTPAEMNDDDL